MISFLHCCYFAAKLVIKTTILSLISFLVLKIRFSNVQNNELDAIIECDVNFYATSCANDVLKVDVI